MSAFAPALAEKLGDLLKLILGAATDGESLAAVRALNRTLKTAGSDHHELAKIVKNGGGLSEEEMKKIYRAGYAEGHAVASRAVVVRDRFHDAAEWRVTLDFCVRHAHHLGPRDRDFLESMDGWDDEPTEKQGKWLNDIAARLRRRGAK